MLREFIAETNVLVVIINVLVVIIGACMTIISFFLVRTLKQVDRNQTKLFEKFENHEQRLSTIEGAHNAIVGKGHP